MRYPSFEPCVSIPTNCYHSTITKIYKVFTLIISMKTYNTLREKLTNFERKYFGETLATEINPKGLAGIVGAGIIATGLFGCGNMRLNQENLGYNFNFTNQTQNDSLYNIERIMLHGKEFYARVRKVNDNTELPFELLPFDKVSRIIDLDANNPTKRTKLESEESYIPKNAEAPGTTNNYVDILVLDRNNNPQYKIKGIRSNVKKTDVSSLTDSEFNGSSIKKTEQDACYGIRKATIFGNEYFFPHVAESKVEDKGKLDFYLIPVEGSNIRIKNATGEVSIENDDRIYRPQTIPLPVKEVVERKPETTTPATEVKTESK